MKSRQQKYLQYQFKKNMKQNKLICAFKSNTATELITKLNNLNFRINNEKRRENVRLSKLAKIPMVNSVVTSLSSRPSNKYVSLIDGLPDELLVRIFSYLTPYELCCISFVSTRLNNISNDDELWKSFIDCKTIDTINLQSQRKFNYKSIFGKNSLFKKDSNLEKSTSIPRNYHLQFDEDNEAYFDWFVYGRPFSR